MVLHRPVELAALIRTWSEENDIVTIQHALESLVPGNRRRVGPSEA